MRLNQVKFKDINGRKHRQYVTQRTGSAEYSAVDVYANVVVGPFLTSQESEDFLRETDEDVLNQSRVRIAGLIH